MFIVGISDKMKKNILRQKEEKNKAVQQTEKGFPVECR
jgi:hypothetical protein